MKSAMRTNSNKQTDRREKERWLNQDEERKRKKGVRANGRNIESPTEKKYIISKNDDAEEF